MSANRCSCGKIRYETENDAILAAFRVHKASGQPQRHYFSRQCGCWHTTRRHIDPGAKRYMGPRKRP